MVWADAITGPWSAPIDIGPGKYIDSGSIHAPWRNAPNNPITRTTSVAEPWWSRGHATLVEGSDGRLYHGYENGYWTLGRQALLDPIEWTTDGWFVAKGGDLGTPLKKPSG